MASPGSEDRPGMEDDEDDLRDIATSPNLLAEGKATRSWVPATSSAESSPCMASTSPKHSKPSHAFFASRFQLPPQCADSDWQRHALNLAPLPNRTGSVKATLRRHRGTGLFSQHQFLLFIDSDENSQPVLLAVAQRTAATRGSMKPHYIISSSPHEQRFDRSSPHFLARLAGNLMGSHYVLHGRGANPADTTIRQPGGQQWREELLELRFKKPTDAPRSMEVAIPRIRYDGTRTELRPSEPEQGLSRAWCSNSQDEFHYLSSPPAVWDEHRKVYSMNFYGRVGRASAKNFQLASTLKDFQQDTGGLCMQFGRVEDDSFNIDVGHPLSPLQAFAIALSMFDHRPAETLRMYY